MDHLHLHRTDSWWSLRRCSSCESTVCEYEKIVVNKVCFIDSSLSWGLSLGWTWGLNLHAVSQNQTSILKYLYLFKLKFVLLCHLNHLIQNVHRSENNSENDFESQTPHKGLRILKNSWKIWKPNSQAIGTKVWYLENRHDSLNQSLSLKIQNSPKLNLEMWNNRVSSEWNDH